VSGLRSIASAEGFTMPASDLGKTKMVLQVVAITVIVLERRYPPLQPLGDVFLWLVVGIALLSAAGYFWAFWKKLEARLKQPTAAAGRVVVIRGGEKEQGKKDAAAQ